MRYKREVQKTLLVVGEGDAEVAFLKHLRSLYCTQGAGVRVTIRNAHGKGPGNVVTHAARLAQGCSYDSCVALLDTDIEWTEELKKRARKAKIELVGSSPCIEGLLLLILRKRCPEQSAQCKRELKRNLGYDVTEWEHCAHVFPKTVLDGARTRISELDRLIKQYEG